MSCEQAANLPWYSNSQFLLYSGVNFRLTGRRNHGMEELSKVGLGSKRTTAASVAVVGLVVYLALIHLKSILMPLAIAILLYFIIKPPEQYIYRKVDNRFVSYGTVILTFIIGIYFISIFSGSIPLGRYLIISNKPIPIIKNLKYGILSMR